MARPEWLFLLLPLAAALRCRCPINRSFGAVSCPGLAGCKSDHHCAWHAIKYALPPSLKMPVIEVARHTPWGFYEYGKLRHNVAVSDFGSAARELLVLASNGTRAMAVVLHILVGEGLTRASWRAVAAAAMRGGATEVWVMEHNAIGASWRNRSSWPSGSGSDSRREDGSDMFTLEELRMELLTLAQHHCRNSPQLLASCLVPGDPGRDPARNLLVGVQCACTQQWCDLPIHARDDDGLFCRLQADRPDGEVDGQRQNIYDGVNFVYVAHADPPRFLLHTPALRSFLQAPDDVKSFTFASVIGSMAGLNLLVNLTVNSIVLFDINEWMVEYAVMMIEIIRSSVTRLDFLSKMFSRDAGHAVSLAGGFDLKPSIADTFLKQPVQWNSAETLQASLSKRSACAHRWLTSQIVLNLTAIPTGTHRRVSERVTLFHDPRKSPMLEPNLVRDCNASVRPEKQPKCDPQKWINTCSFYYGHGWLTSEATFANVRSKLIQSPVHCIHWDTTQPLDKLLRVEADRKRRVLMYVSNIASHVGRRSWLASTSSWATELHGTRTSLHILHKRNLHNAKVVGQQGGMRPQAILESVL